MHMFQSPDNMRSHMRFVQASVVTDTSINDAYRQFTGIMLQAFITQCNHCKIYHNNSVS